MLLRELSGRFYKLSLLGREVVEWWLVLGGKVVGFGGGVYFDFVTEEGINNTVVWG